MSEKQRMSRMEVLKAYFSTPDHPVTNRELMDLKKGPKPEDRWEPTWAPWSAEWWAELAEGAALQLGVALV